MEEVFGFNPAQDILARGERLCTEPLVRGADYHKRIHALFEMLPAGDMKCKHCGARFKDDDLA